MNPLKTASDGLDAYEASIDEIKAHKRFCERNYGFEMNRARTTLGISLRELAGQTGLSAPFLCDIENGNRKPTRQTRQKINSVLL